MYWIVLYVGGAAASLGSAIGWFKPTLRMRRTASRAVVAYAGGLAGWELIWHHWILVGLNLALVGLNLFKLARLRETGR